MLLSSTQPPVGQRAGDREDHSSLRGVSEDQAKSPSPPMACVAHTVNNKAAS